VKVLANQRLVHDTDSIFRSYRVSDDQTCTLRYDEIRVRIEGDDLIFEYIWEGKPLYEARGSVNRMQHAGHRLTAKTNGTFDVTLTPSAA